MCTSACLFREDEVGGSNGGMHPCQSPVCMASLLGCLLGARSCKHQSMVIVGHLFTVLLQKIGELLSTEVGVVLIAPEGSGEASSGSLRGTPDSSVPLPTTGSVEKNAWLPAKLLCLKS